MHQLTAESASLHRALTSAPAIADRLDVVRQVDAVDRDRALLEINLLSHGIPALWIDVARRLGAAHQPWTTDQILPPARTDTRRSSHNRVAADTHLLVDMAAVSVVRDHLLNHHRNPIDTTTADAVQFRRNMGAVWQRSVLTAQLTKVSHHKCVQFIDTATADLTQRIGRYRAMSLDDIQTLWHAYTGGDLADTYRRSITASTRSVHQPSPHLPDPQHWLDHARQTFMSARPPEQIRQVHCAVAAALPGHILEDRPGPTHQHENDEIPSADNEVEAGPGP
ncbi:hypothetical protein [Nocardia farcinica]|uniref:hypothetical protein n=1 Tax=Nocardia farcinica TaxID=37329 RepID=UPI002453F668|nr:hypothetical protein [Nocardia farcinica]